MPSTPPAAHARSPPKRTRLAPRVYELRRFAVTTKQAALDALSQLAACVERARVTVCSLPVGSLAQEERAEVDRLRAMLATELGHRRRQLMGVEQLMAADETVNFAVATRRARVTFHDVRPVVGQFSAIIRRARTAQP